MLRMMAATAVFFLVLGTAAGSVAVEEDEENQFVTALYKWLENYGGEPGKLIGCDAMQARAVYMVEAVHELCRERGGVRVFSTRRDEVARWRIRDGDAECIVQVLAIGAWNNRHDENSYWGFSQLGGNAGGYALSLGECGHLYISAGVQFEDFQLDVHMSRVATIIIRGDKTLARSLGASYRRIAEALERRDRPASRR